MDEPHAEPIQPCASPSANDLSSELPSMENRSNEKVTGREAVPATRPALSRIGLPLLLALVTFVFYAPSLKSDFVYDAHYEIFEEGFITSLANLPTVLSLKVLNAKLLLGSRPGSLLFLMLNAAVWGKVAWGFHLTCNLLHAANVALLFVLLRQLAAAETRKQTAADSWRISWAAAACALIFALHPIATEPVAVIGYSSDLLVTFFALLALVAATRFRPQAGRDAWLIGGAGVLCAVASVTCKESGLLTAPLLAVYWFLFRRDEDKRPWLIFIGAAAAGTFAFLFARFHWPPPAVFRAEYPGGSLAAAIWIQPRLWVFMMGKLIWPAHLSADYTLLDAGVPSTPVALVILVPVLAAQVALAIKSRLGALGVFIFWASLATVSNFTPLYRIDADRFYYLPLAGLAMQVVALLLIARRLFWPSVAFLLAAVPFLTLLTVKRQAVFANEMALWSDTVFASPNSKSAWNFLGKELAAQGRTDEAVAAYQTALSLDPNYAEAHNNLGYALFQRGKVEEAIVEYQRVLGFDFNGRVHTNLGRAFAQEGQLPAAISAYQEALAINPNNDTAHSNLGVALFQTGHGAEAMSHLKAAVALNPGSDEAHNNLGNGFWMSGQPDAAIAQYEVAVAINPRLISARRNLGVAYARKGLLDQAIAQIEVVVQLNPGDAQAHKLLEQLEADARQRAGPK